MPGLNTPSPAIVVLGVGAMQTARRIQSLYSGARVLGLRDRVSDADSLYDNFGETLRELYRSGTPIVALCAAGIVIRSLAEVLGDKDCEPPVLAVAADGSAVVPLLGGLGGVNHMAREIAEQLQTVAAITTTGELRFGTCLLDPPAGYRLADIEQGKRFVSDLLAGESMQIVGTAPWLDQTPLPLMPDASHRVLISPYLQQAEHKTLQVYPQQVVVYVEHSGAGLDEELDQLLVDNTIARQSLACLVAPVELTADSALASTASRFGVPLRFVENDHPLPPLKSRSSRLQLLMADEPVGPMSIGNARGSLTVIGLGPGAAELMVPAARQALDEADDLLGYETYVKMAGPLRPGQVAHSTDNREEMQRARHAFELATSGRRVVVISSGDPGVFAMAAAVLEALHHADDPRWHTVDLQVLPGVSAALATAAKAGAPLGHDFCVLSLSDNLKPWSIIETRLDHAAAADLVMAFYNPISRARPWQLGRALDILRTRRSPETLVVLGRDIGRPGETLKVLTLGELTPDLVDMRTLVIIGSSQSCRFSRADGGEWVYTPRFYPAP
jgi:cobalt-precorrin 5A hydrolase/precorrin-3B C17-methyltransferase